MQRETRLEEWKSGVQYSNITSLYGSSDITSLKNTIEEQNRLFSLSIVSQFSKKGIEQTLFSRNTQKKDSGFLGINHVLESIMFSFFLSIFFFTKKFYNKAQTRNQEVLIKLLKLVSFEIFFTKNFFIVILFLSFFLYTLLL